MEIVRDKNLTKLQQLAGRKLSDLLNLDDPTLLLVAGGSSFAFLDYVDSECFRTNLMVQMSDERFEADPAKNNFSQLLQRDFYKRSILRGVSFFDSSVQQNESFEKYTLRFEKNILDWVQKNKNGKIVATFGIGPDGHTCGMMPFPENPTQFKDLFENKNFVTGFDATGKNEFPLRVTITVHFLRKYVSSGVLYATGEGKRKAFEKFLCKDGNLSETPARILFEIPNVTLFTDLLFSSSSFDKISPC